MSARLVLLAVIAVGVGATLRLMPASADVSTLPDPPVAVARTAMSPPPLDPAILQRLRQTPLKFVAPVDPTNLPQPAVDPASLRLVGVVMASGRALAIFTSNGGAPQTLARGEEVGGWRIIAINERRVRLSRDGDIIEKALFERTVQTQAAPPPQMSPPAAPLAPSPQQPAARPRSQEQVNVPPVIYMPPAPPITK